jgi:hypothetical protein
MERMDEEMMGPKKSYETEAILIAHKAERDWLSSPKIRADACKATEKNLMNPATGSVATEAEWRADFARMDPEEWGADTFEGAGLVEVRRNAEGDWEEVDTLRAHLRKAGSARTPAKAAQSRVNGARGGRPYRWMLVRKISGIPVSRHATREAASKASAKWPQPERDPLELREYNAGYRAKMTNGKAGGK